MYPLHRIEQHVNHQQHSFRQRSDQGTFDIQRLAAAADDAACNDQVTLSNWKVTPSGGGLETTVNVAPNFGNGYNVSEIIIGVLSQDILEVYAAAKVTLPTLSSVQAPGGSASDMTTLYRGGAGATVTGLVTGMLNALGSSCSFWFKKDFQL